MLSFEQIEEDFQATLEIFKAQVISETEREHGLSIIGFSDREIITVPVFSKELFFMVAKVLFWKFGATHYFAFSEAWAAEKKVPPGNDPLKYLKGDELKPSLDPKRREIVIATAVTREKNVFKVFNLERKEGRIFLHEDKALDASNNFKITSGLGELLPPLDTDGTIIPFPENRWEMFKSMLNDMGYSIEQIKTDPLNRGDLH